MTENVPKTCKEITHDNLTAKHKTVSIMWPSFQIHRTKVRTVRHRGKGEFCMLPD